MKEIYKKERNFACVCESVKMKRKTSLANLEGIPFLAMMWCMCIQACTNASIHACYFLVRLGQHLGLIGLDKGDRDIYRRGRTISEISRSGLSH